MESSARAAAVLIVGRSLGFVATFAIPVVLARVFSQADFGTYKQLFLVYGTLHGIAQLGMAESLYFFLPRAPAQASRHVWNAVATLTLAGGLCLAGLWLSSTAIALWLGNGDLARYLPALGVFVALTVVSAVLEIAMIARKLYATAATTYLSSDLFKAALLVGPAVIVGTVDALLAGALAFGALRCGAMLTYLGREFRGDGRLEWSLWKRQVAYAGPFALAVGIDILQANFHQYAVAARFDAALFAIYAVGCLQIPFVDLVASSAGNVMMVRMAEELREGRSQAVLGLWHETTARLALVVFPITAFLLVAARDIIVLLFTERYLDSVPIFVVASAAIVLSSLSVEAVLRVYAQMRFLLAMNLLRLLLLAASIRWFLDALNLVGAVLVTVVAAAAVKAVGLARVARLLGVSPAELLPWRELGAAMVVAAGASVPALLLRPSLGVAALPGLVIVAASYGLAYVALACLVPGMRERTRRAVFRWRPTRMASWRFAGDARRAR